MTASLSDLLRKLLEMSGSDLHITTNSPPQIRVHGHLQPLDMPPLTPAETKQLAYSVLTDAQKHRFEENLELDFSFGLSGALPWQLVQSARRDRRRLPRHSLRDQVIPTAWTPTSRL
jgi:Tfp pilus assembly pilus retraction ATPase PilT